MRKFQIDMHYLGPIPILGPVFRLILIYESKTWLSNWLWIENEQIYFKKYFQTFEYGPKISIGPKKWHVAYNRVGEQVHKWGKFSVVVISDK